MKLFEHETDNGSWLMVDDTFAAGGLSFQILQHGGVARVVLSPEAAAELLEALRANVQLETDPEVPAKRFLSETRIVVGDVEITDSTGRPMYELAGAARSVVQEVHRSGTAEVAEARLEKIKDLQAALDAGSVQLKRLNQSNNEITMRLTAARAKLDVAREAIKLALMQWRQTQGAVSASEVDEIVAELTRALAHSSW